MSSISFPTFFASVNSALKSLPTIEKMKDSVIQIPGNYILKDFFLETLDLLKKNALLLARALNHAEGANGLFIKLSNVVIKQANFMNRNLQLISLAMLTLFASDTKYLKPGSEADKKLPYLRTVLKTVGYVAIASAIVMSLKAKGEIKSDLFGLRGLAEAIKIQEAHLSAIV